MGDPWAGLPPAGSPGTVTAIRADSEHRWAYYWARDANGRRAWVMSVQSSSVGSAVLPELRNLDMAFGDPGDSDQAHLWIALKDPDAKDLFHRLCLDVMEAGDKAPTEPDAVARVIARTWRWHHLMRGGSSPTLSDIQQKGLIGEIRFIEADLIPTIGAKAAVSGWFGPLDGPKDFEFAPVAVEVKALRSGAVPAVHISSEHQLDQAEFRSLYLVVSSVDEVHSEGADAATLHGWVNRLRAQVEDHSPGTVDLLESRLTAVGYRIEDTYTKIWSIGATSVYSVGADFPKITPATLAPGVRKVNYQIGLTDVAGSLVTPETMHSDLKATSG